MRCTRSGLRCGFLRGVMVCVLAASFTTVGLSFQEPRRLSDGTATATDCVLGIDSANNAYIVSVVDDELRVHLIGADLDVELEIPATGLGQGEPSIVNSSRGETYICFSQLDIDAGDAGRDIFLLNNGGGRFSEPVQLSTNRVDDFGPSMVLDGAGLPHLVWTRDLVDTTRIIYWSPVGENLTGGVEVEVGEGVYPSVFVDATGAAHIVFTRENDVYYVSNEGGEFGEAVRVVETPSEPEFSVGLGGTSEARLFLAYESGGDLYIAAKRPGESFGVPVLVEAGGVLEPRLEVRPTGTIGIVYTKNGDLQFYQGFSADFLIGPNPVGEPTERVESRPGLSIDTCSIVHAVFLSDGETYYRNDSEEIVAEFEADVTRGEGPLLVQFQAAETGKVQVYQWDFGDGSFAAGPTAEHIYQAVGWYTVTLRMFTADREAEIVKENYIRVLPPSNRMWVPDQRVRQGDVGVRMPVKVLNSDAVMAYQINGRYDPAVLSVTDCDLEGTPTAGLDPEIWECNIREEEGRFEVGCVFDFAPPFDMRTLPPSVDATLIYLVYDVSPDAPTGAGEETVVELFNDREISQIFNVFTVDNQSVLPALGSATVRVESAGLEEAGFIRGDVDLSGRVDITDSINILNFLFTGGAAPACMDAADPADLGRVDISAAVFLLNFLFQGGEAPAQPHPYPGLDVGEDDLDCQGAS